VVASRHAKAVIWNEGNVLCDLFLGFVKKDLSKVGMLIPEFVANRCLVVENWF